VGQLLETREFLRFSKNRNVCCLVTLRRNVDFGFWILNVGLADEGSFQRILNQGLLQRLQQGGIGVRKFWILDFEF
jgi:hypothetical protein